MKIDFKVRVKDFAPGLLRDLRKQLDGVVVRAGFLDGVPGENGQSGSSPVDGAPDLDLAGLSAIAEFGATVHRGRTIVVLPERSHIRAALEANRSKITEHLGVALRAIAEGRIDTKKGMWAVSQVMAKAIKDFIRENKVRPPDAPATIARKEKLRAKGNTDPVVTLEDTAQLVRAVQGDVQMPGHTPGHSQTTV